MNGVKHSGSRESILVVADSFFPVRIPDRADDEKGVKLPLAYISLVDAVTALGSMAGTIIVDCFQSLPDDLAVTAITHLIITPRGHIVVASTKTLTINGKITVLTSTPFAGPGSVAYGANAMRNVMGPANMSGMAGKAPIVNIGEDGFAWGAVSTPDISYFRKYGTTDYEAWFTSPKAGTLTVPSALVANRLYAMPFIVPKNITVDRIGVQVTTLSTTTARLGIYSDNGNCYPGSLLLDAGTIDVTSTGAKTIMINQALAAGLYWLVIICAATPSIACIATAAVISILGHASANLNAAQNMGLYVAQTYGTLPGTFPASPTMITAAPIPAIFVRLSA